MKNTSVFVAIPLMWGLVSLSGCGNPAADTKPQSSTSTSSSTSTALTTTKADVGDVAQPAPETTNIRGWRRDGTGRFLDATSLPEQPFSAPVPTEWNAETPPTEWDEKKFKWRTPVDGSNSTPVVISGKVFVTSEKSLLTCLDRTNGQILWKKTHNAEDVPAEFKDKVKERLDGQSDAGFATPTPVCGNEGVFVVFGSGVICRYDLDGNRKWFRFIEPVGLHYGSSASPLLGDGKLVVSLDGLAALDAQTGSTVWEHKDVENAYGTPAFMTLGQTRVIVTPTGFVVRLSDGKVLDKDIAPDLSGDEFSISPIVQDDVVYFIDRTCTAVKLTLQGDTVQHKQLWPAELEEAAYGSPVIHDGLIFAVGKSGHYSVLDARDGKKLLDKDMDDLPPDIYPSLSVAGHYLYISNDKGLTVVLEASKEYKEVHRNQLPEGSGACLNFDGPDLFLRAGDFLYCIGPK